jgi:hypothetical protein
MSDDLPAFLIRKNEFNVAYVINVHEYLSGGQGIAEGLQLPNLTLTVSVVLSDT